MSDDIDAAEFESREKQFMQGALSIENCATCKFFRHGGTFRRLPPRFENGGDILQLVGCCKRYPPQVARMGSCRRGAERDQPIVAVEVAECNTQNGTRFWSVSDGAGDTPWCGEYVRDDDLQFVDSGSLPKEGYGF